MRSVLTISGLTCAGKDHLARELLRSREFERVVTTTTRNPREGEVHGNSYYFIGQEQFDERVRSGRFIEHVKIKDESYGIETQSLTPAFAKGQTALVICDPRGMESMRAHAEKEGLGFRSIFLEIAFEEQVRRMFERFANDGNADPAVYAARMNHIVEEEQQWTDFDYDTRYKAFGPESQAEVIWDVLETCRMMRNGPGLATQDLTDMPSPPVATRTPGL